MPLNLYLIALLPPPDLRERVRLLKEEMRNRFGSGHALKSPAHITLQMPFRLESEAEVLLIKRLKGFGGQQHSFLVELQGFGCFPPRVLFVRIGNPGPVTALESALRLALAQESALEITPSDLPFHPHMTIATRDLEEPAFQMAWAEFKDRPFQEVFEASSLFLLKHNGQSWAIFREFRFGASS